MTYEEFYQLTVVSITELCRRTERYTTVLLSGRQPRFRVSVMGGDIAEDSVSLEEFVEAIWSEDGFPWVIRIRIQQVTDADIIILALVGRKHPHSDPEWDEWSERMRRAHPPRTPYLPYLILIPAPPEEWLEFSPPFNRNGEGTPDFEKSLALHGRYPWGVHYQYRLKRLDGKLVRVQFRTDMNGRKIETEQQETPSSE